MADSLNWRKRDSPNIVQKNEDSKFKRYQNFRGTQFYQLTPILNIPNATNLRISIGIACIDFSDVPRILIIRKRCTYAYNTFVHGKYEQSEEALLNLFNQMTCEEKIDILSENFDMVWYRFWLHAPKRASYNHAKEIYNTFVVPNILKIRKLIAQSKNANYLWEIPKGRRETPLENSIQCAIREFQEETNIHNSQYKLLPHPHNFTFTDEGITYKNIYYVAVLREPSAPTVSFQNSRQVDEVGDIRWASLRDLKYLPCADGLYKFTKTVMKYAKKYWWMFKKK